MKVFISSDIEGTAGITDWDEALKNRVDYAEFRDYMTAEVVAACEGAKAAGAKEVVIKDAHDSGRNLIIGRLPDYARVIRSWSGHPDSMMFGIDESFDAAIYIGYHDKAGAETNPLAHSFTSTISKIWLNGELASEFTFNARTAGRYGVKSAFLSGDAGICKDAAAIVPGIVTLATSQGFGPATNSLTPAASVTAIRDGVEAALAGGQGGLPAKAERYELMIEFTNPVLAYKGSFYPGVEYLGERTLRFTATDYFEISRAMRFIK